MGDIPSLPRLEPQADARCGRSPPTSPSRRYDAAISRIKDVHSQGGNSHKPGARSSRGKQGQCARSQQPSHPPHAALAAGNAAASQLTARLTRQLTPPGAALDPLREASCWAHQACVGTAPVLVSPWPQRQRCAVPQGWLQKGGVGPGPGRGHGISKSGQQCPQPQRAAAVGTLRTLLRLCRGRPRSLWRTQGTGSMWHVEETSSTTLGGLQTPPPGACRCLRGRHPRPTGRHLRPCPYGWSPHPSPPPPPPAACRPACPERWRRPQPRQLARRPWPPPSARRGAPAAGKARRGHAAQRRRGRWPRRAPRAGRAPDLRSVQGVRQGVGSVEGRPNAVCGSFRLRCPGQKMVASMRGTRTLRSPGCLAGQLGAGGTACTQAAGLPGPAACAGSEPRRRSAAAQLS